MTTYQWGMIGTGDIARQFAASFSSRQSNLRAVTARSKEKTEKFARQFQIPVVYPTVDGLLADPAIDIIYIAVPNNIHHNYIIKALEKGKHVLCEKAITMDLAQLEEEIDLAQKKGLILQEAMTIFNMPLYQKLKEIAASGQLGRLKMIQAPFGSYKEPDPNNRFFNPDLAGGALLDIGTYAVSFARWFLSESPAVLFSQMIPFKTGVDETSITVLQTPNQELASVNLSFQAKMPKKGIVAYENGYITVNDYPRADRAEITYRDGQTQTIQAGETAQALNYEIENMIAAIESKSNPTLPLTKDVIQILDNMRQKWRQ